MEEGKDDIHRLVLDFTNVPYVSSAGLAILLALQKKYGRSLFIRLTGVAEELLAIFEIAGFTQVLKID